MKSILQICLGSPSFKVNQLNSLGHRCQGFKLESECECLKSETYSLCLGSQGFII